MMYFTNTARVTAKEEIKKLYVKLANTAPTDQLNRDDIRSLMHCLRTMDDELSREIKQHS